MLRGRFGSESAGRPVLRNGSKTSCELEHMQPQSSAPMLPHSPPSCCSSPWAAGFCRPGSGPSSFPEAHEHGHEHAHLVQMISLFQPTS